MPPGWTSGLPLDLKLAILYTVVSRRNQALSQQLYGLPRQASGDWINVLKVDTVGCQRSGEWEGAGRGRMDKYCLDCCFPFVFLPLFFSIISRLQRLRSSILDSRTSKLDTSQRSQQGRTGPSRHHVFQSPQLVSRLTHRCRLQLPNLLRCFGHDVQ